VTLLLALFAGLLCSYRVNEAIHEDSVLWYGFTQKFWAALARGQLERTYAVPHPGVTMMWLVGIVMKLAGSLDGAINPLGVWAVKALGVLVGTCSAALTFPLAIACLGRPQWRAALVLSALLATEPLLVQQARVGEVDMGALGLTWLSLWLAMLAYERNSWRWALGAGVLAGAGAITKLTFAAMPTVLMMLLIGSSALTRFRDRRGPRVAVVAGVTAAATAFALWPALWTHPIATLLRMFGESRQQGQRGNYHMVDGDWVLDPGVHYYLSFVVEVINVETMILALGGAAALWYLPALRKHYAWLIVSILPYLLILAMIPKKHSRYWVPVAPILCLLASASIEWLWPRVSKWAQGARLARFVPALLVSLMFVGRYARELSLLPHAEPCARWPGVVCKRPWNSHFTRELGLAMRKDWQAGGHRGRPRVYLSDAEQRLMSPWLAVKATRSMKKADYIVIWDSVFDEHGLNKAAARRLRRGSEEVYVASYAGSVVARLFRGR
jgi:hypothetical protein